MQDERKINRLRNVIYWTRIIFRTRYILVLVLRTLDAIQLQDGYGNYTVKFAGTQTLHIHMTIRNGGVFPVLRTVPQKCESFPFFLA